MKEDTAASLTGRRRVRRWTHADAADGEDCVAVEAPLEIYVDYRFKERSTRKLLAITMRTPGADRELAAGFLLSEAIVCRREELVSLRESGPGAATSWVAAELSAEVEIPPDAGRAVLTTSACGVCGRRWMEETDAQVEEGMRLPAERVADLCRAFDTGQVAFAATGGLHAAALFTEQGELAALREDVGRHNAFDKLIGGSFLAGRLPLHQAIAVVSSRASFELVAKSAVAGIPVLAALGAPTTLAIDEARRRGITLIGFLREGRFNIYTAPWRVLT
ncbi:MAG: formate dehydrogenase accessory sulfurtransferase FdhD [Bryobacteraceae bacterium]|nr:formate dehydrogenase accessory sulfurtransferase FdhD [Bryobacteraceae bacterium]